jgi:hypothetical protein
MTRFLNGMGRRHWIGALVKLSVLSVAILGVRAYFNELANCSSMSTQSSRLNKISYKPTSSTIPTAVATDISTEEVVFASSLSRADFVAAGKNATFGPGVRFCSFSAPSIGLKDAPSKSANELLANQRPNRFLHLACETCDGETCSNTETCSYTCDGEFTCGHTCDGSDTCDERITCDGSETCGSSTCDGSDTCGNTCDGSFTCGSTCDGSNTCDERITCEGTCDGSDTCDNSEECCSQRVAALFPFGNSKGKGSTNLKMPRSVVALYSVSTRFLARD